MKLKTISFGAKLWYFCGRRDGVRNDPASLADRYRDEKQKDDAAWEKEVMGEEFSYSLKQGGAR
jgi:hypothetical protein